VVYFVGIDFGTSGARLNVIDESHQIYFEKLIVSQSSRDRTDSEIWTQTLFLLLNSIPRGFKTQIRRIAIDGTSATVLLCDERGIPLASPKLYNQNCNAGVIEKLKAVAPPGHVVLSSTSSFAKLLSWQDYGYFVQARFLLHQADWLAAQLHGQFGLYGVYSHWFNGKWLVGGASNSGGAVLSHFFSDAELAHLSEKIDWANNQHFPVYVPLLSPGERFPINDPMLQPCFEPRAEDPVEFLQALLASLTQVEVEGYQKLKALGASSLTRVYTAGGGAKNLGWMQWRRKTLGVPVVRSPQPEAAYGAAKLAAGVLTQCSLGYAREL
jgi:sugar (pentulose or hexulose) kinase